MVEFKLTSHAALKGMHEAFGATVIREIDDARIMVNAIPSGLTEEVRRALRGQLGCALPGPGQAALSRTSGVHVLRLAADRLMILSLPRSSLGAGTEGPAPIGPCYKIDQTDFWVTLELAGPLAVAALERCCRLDLDASVFSPGHFARTPLESVSTILLRVTQDRFLALAPRSFARSLAETFARSIRHVHA